MEKIRENKIPTICVFSANDKLVEKEIFDEMIDLIGSRESALQKYDLEGKKVTRCKLIYLNLRVVPRKPNIFLLFSVVDPASHTRVLYFDRGGHYAFLKYSDEVIQQCDLFLNHVLMHK